MCSKLPLLCAPGKLKVWACGRRTPKLPTSQLQRVRRTQVAEHAFDLYAWTAATKCRQRRCQVSYWWKDGYAWKAGSDNSLLQQSKHVVYSVRDTHSPTLVEMRPHRLGSHCQHRSPCSAAEHRRQSQTLIANSFAKVSRREVFPGLYKHSTLHTVQLTTCDRENLSNSPAVTCADGSTDCASFPLWLAVGTTGVWTLLSRPGKPAVACQEICRELAAAPLRWAGSTGERKTGANSGFVALIKKRRRQLHPISPATA